MKFIFFLEYISPGFNTTQITKNVPWSVLGSLGLYKVAGSVLTSNLKLWNLIEGIPKELTLLNSTIKYIKKNLMKKVVCTLRERERESREHFRLKPTYVPHHYLEE